MELGQTIPSEDQFFNIHFVVNDGVAFSLLKGHPEILIILQSVLFTAIAIVVVVCYIKRFSPVLLVALTWIIAGGAGNLIDRVRFHYVIDYISVGSFPIWNFADMAIVGGCILVAIFILFVYKDGDEGDLKDNKEENPEETNVV